MPTIEVAYLPGQKVRIDTINAVVISVRRDLNGNMYECQWWNNGVITSGWFFMLQLAPRHE